MKKNSTGLQSDQFQMSALQHSRQPLELVSLRCVECNAQYPAIEAAPRYRCNCGGVLDVEMPFAHPSQQPALQEAFEAMAASESDLTPPAGASWRQLFDERAAPPTLWNTATNILDRSGVWLYPVGLDHVDDTRKGHSEIGRFAGVERLFLKHEGENPTGSFKDRGMTVGVSMAKMLGARAVACASTGNTSASLASYAAQAGMQCFVFLPASNVAAGKLAQTLAYGATTIQVRGDFDDAMRLVEQVCDELGIYLLNSLNPYRIEGQKAIAFETLQQLDWQAPDWLVLPAGNLGNTSAIGKALQQAYQLGLISHLPRIASIQAAGANPFYRSFVKGFATRESVQAQTVATAIKIGNPVSFTRARRVIEQTNGLVEMVSDEEILEAKRVIDRAGIGCEPASAASLAGVRKLVQQGRIKRDERVVAILTGNLLKDSQTGIPEQRQETVVDAHMDAVRNLLQKFV